MKTFAIWENMAATANIFATVSIKTLRIVIMLLESVNVEVLSEVRACLHFLTRCLCLKCCMLVFFNFAGVKCETECSEGFYGENCDVACDCSNESSCDRKTGTCNCARGWTDKKCDAACSNGFYGLRCNETCIRGKFGAYSSLHRIIVDSTMLFVNILLSLS